MLPVPLGCGDLTNPSPFYMYARRTHAMPGTRSDEAAIEPGHGLAAPTAIRPTARRGGFPLFPEGQKPPRWSRSLRRVCQSSSDYPAKQHGQAPPGGAAADCTGVAAADAASDEGSAGASDGGVMPNVTM